MIEPLLLDTSIASLLHPKKMNDPLRALYGPDLEDREMALSFQTLAELYLWADRNQMRTATQG